ncbi:helix-turn-helix transcriptional regulator [Halopiger aswanensis]|uniref:Putative transcriptional regulator n=1 Tax=Halopiger aswanensis TaxID=148449 RepID=A0A3R7GTJ5_9EURY|nr:MarR family transcriptional regulator [Halopiger aswanensis]RKD89093.1 putative transcriptional regulator [Halopiger aswanensis]
MGDVSDVIDTIRKRSDVLAELAEEPLQPRELVDRLAVSRSTVTRALGDLEDADLVAKRDGRYVATRFGEIAIERFERYSTEIETLVSIKPLTQAFPTADPPPIELLEGADIVLQRHDGAFRPLEIVEETFRTASGAAIAYFPTVVNPNLPRVWERTAGESDTDLTIILEGETYDCLRTRYEDELTAIASQSDAALYVGDGPSFGLVCIDAGDQFTVLVVIYAAGGVEGVIVNRSAELHEWVRGLFDRIRTDADPVDASLRERDSVVVDPS